MHIPLHNIEINILQSPIFTQNNITVSVARLDKIHPQVSGNKIFKLHYYIKACLQTTHKTLLTYGGAYSNHLVATAYYCSKVGIKSIGIVRGNEEQKNTSHSLAACKAYGMQLFFVDRETYKNNATEIAVNSFTEQFGTCTIIPEGGYAAEGAKGAALIAQTLIAHSPTHICTSVGTATTLAGLLFANTTANIIAVPAIKNMIDIKDRITHLIGHYNHEKLSVFNDYTFGGYAKHNPTLTNFMNEFYTAENIPTDFIYTAKMMYGIQQQLQQGYFKNGSNVICLHTGGLQGNLSLPQNTLIF